MVLSIRQRRELFVQRRAGDPKQAGGGHLVAASEGQGLPDGARFEFRNERDEREKAEKAERLAKAAAGKATQKKVAPAPPPSPPSAACSAFSTAWR